MKINRVLISILFLAGIFAVPARAELNCQQLYVAGPAVTGNWEADQAQEMVSLGNDCFLWDGWLYEDQFKFINVSGKWENNSVVADAEDLEFETGVSYNLVDNTANDHYDFKFVNKKAGYVRIVVDLRNLKVNFRRPVLGMVGEAALGWVSSGAPGQTQIPVFADDNGNVEWEGKLNGGELKFLAGECSDWYPCYNAPTEGDGLWPGGHQMLYNDGQGSAQDYKYRVPEAGYYMLKFKRDNPQARFYGLDVTYKIYSHLYITGNAAPDNWNADLVDEMTPLGNGSFLWDGWLNTGELKFLSVRGDWGSSVVAGSDGLVFSDGVSYVVVDQALKNYDDCKFVNPKAGFVRIVVDTKKMRVNFRRPVLCIVGDGALGWGSPDPGKKVIPMFADDESKVEWSGQLRRGEVKFLAGDGSGWYPCYNAPQNLDELWPGDHGMSYNDGQGSAEDFKYLVPVSGYYSLTFKNEGSDHYYSVNVTTDAAPSLDGVFTGRPGRYLTAVDRDAMRVHMAPVPARLYIGTSGSDCQEISSVADDKFSAEVYLQAGRYYKLSSNQADWIKYALSPNTDVDISSGPTANVAPMHGYSYTVPADGTYLVTADFSGASPQLSAHKQIPSGLGETMSETGVSVRISGGSIVVDGDYSSLAIYDVAGRTAGTASPCDVSPGVYLVKVDKNVFKITVR